MTRECARWACGAETEDSPDAGGWSAAVSGGECERSGAGWGGERARAGERAAEAGAAVRIKLAAGRVVEATVVSPHVYEPDNGRQEM